MDRQVRRSGDDYAEAMLALLPRGQAWPKHKDSVVSKTVYGLCQIFGVVDGRAGDLLRIESDPRYTTEMLADWERNFGLPDDCIPLPPTTQAGRRTALVAKMTLLGGQSRAFFLAQAVALGETVTIEEYAPFMCGVSRCGDTSAEYDGVQPRWELGAPEIRMFWTVKLTHVLTGVECTFRRYKPAHTEIVFKYTSVLDRSASLYYWLGI